MTDSTGENLPTPTEVKTAKRGRLMLVDLLRALAASVIAWHHFSLYPPLSEWAEPICGGLMEWLRVYARATQIFFVVGGFFMARNLSGRSLNLKEAGSVVVQRYCRLGLPYLGAICLSIVACWLGRNSLPLEVVGSPPTIPQLIAHVFFLQDILGYESLSAGLWFVCINFQLGLIFLAMLYLRGPLKFLTFGMMTEQTALIPMLLGWALSAASLFYFNLHDHFNVWAVYFFAYFFLGVMVHYGLRTPKSQIWFWLYVLMIGVAVVFSWRWRLITALVTGMVLFFGSKLGVMERWPNNRVVRYLGQTSYSLFLIHFPVLVFVSTIWTRQNWVTPWDGMMGLLIAYVGSLAVADVFFRVIELPAMRLSKKVAPRGPAAV